MVATFEPLGISFFLLLLVYGAILVMAVIALLRTIRALGYVQEAAKLYLELFRIIQVEKKAKLMAKSQKGGEN